MKKNEKKLDFLKFSRQKSDGILTVRSQPKRARSDGKTVRMATLTDDRSSTLLGCDTPDSRID